MSLKVTVAWILCSSFLAMATRLSAQQPAVGDSVDVELVGDEVTGKSQQPELSTATFGGGCFWCQDMKVGKRKNRPTNKSAPGEPAMQKFAKSLLILKW